MSGVFFEIVTTTPLVGNVGISNSNRNPRKEHEYEYRPYGVKRLTRQENLKKKEGTRVSQDLTLFPSLSQDRSPRALICTLFFLLISPSSVSFHSHHLHPLLTQLPNFQSLRIVVEFLVNKSVYVGMVVSLKLTR